MRDHQHHHRGEHHEAAWPALRATFQVMVELQEQHAEVARPLQLMLRDEPGLRATLQERRTLWLDLLVRD